jgi:hypothetical protein
VSGATLTENGDGEVLRTAIIPERAGSKVEGAEPDREQSVPPVPWPDMLPTCGGEGRRSGAQRRPPAPPGLSNGHIRSLILRPKRKPAQIELWRGGSLVKCSRELEYVPLRQAKRGSVHGFSRKSRGRMIATQAKIRWKTEHLPYFMGNTCPDKVPAPDHVIASWGRFCRRFERRFPKGALLWRKEIKDRKSGTCEGQWVPHYHSFAYNCPRKIEYQEERGEWVKLRQREDGGWTLEIYCLNELGQKVLHSREEMAAGVTDRVTEWWSRNWYEAMGSGEIKHYHAGASFDRIETVEGVRYRSCIERRYRDESIRACKTRLASNTGLDAQAVIQAGQEFRTLLQS